MFVKLHQKGLPVYVNLNLVVSIRESGDGARLQLAVVLGNGQTAEMVVDEMAEDVLGLTITLEEDRKNGGQ